LAGPLPRTPGGPAGAVGVGLEGLGADGGAWGPAPQPRGAGVLEGEARPPLGPGGPQGDPRGQREGGRPSMKICEGHR